MYSRNALCPEVSVPCPWSSELPLLVLSMLPWVPLPRVPHSTAPPAPEGSRCSLRGHWLMHPCDCILAVQYIINRCQFQSALVNCTHLIQVSALVQLGSPRGWQGQPQAASSLLNWALHPAVPGQSRDTRIPTCSWQGTSPGDTCHGAEVSPWRGRRIPGMKAL